MPGRTPGQPVTDGLRLAGRFAAHHDVNLETGRKVGPRRDPGVCRTPRRDGAGRTVRRPCRWQRRELRSARSCRGACRHEYALDLTGAQQRRSAIQGLNPGLFVHTENHGMLRRVHVQPDDVAHLVHGVVLEAPVLKPRGRSVGIRAGRDRIREGAVGRHTTCTLSNIRQLRRIRCAAMNLSSLRPQQASRVSRHRRRSPLAAPSASKSLYPFKTHSSASQSLA